MMYKDNHECENFSPFIKVEELARAYMPDQKMCSIFSEKNSLINGTIFPELYRPYHCNEKKEKFFFIDGE